MLLMYADQSTKMEYDKYCVVERFMGVLWLFAAASLWDLMLESQENP